MTGLGELANARYKAEMADLITTHGDAARVPSDLTRLAGERLRGAHVHDVATARGADPAELMRLYAVDPRVIEEIVGTRPTTKDASRAEKRRRFTEWCLDNPGAKTTTAALAELIGVSPSTIRSMIDDRPDLFRSTGRGTWEIRDPATERANDKNITDKETTSP